MWAVIRTFGLEGTSPLVAMMTFTPYVGLTAPLPLLVALLLRRWGVAAVSLVVVIAFAAALVPRARGGGPRLGRIDSVELRVMTANVFLGRGDARTIVDLVRRHRVDVLAVTEMPPVALRRLDAAGLGRLLPYRQADARRRAQGTGLFSRYPLTKLTSSNSQDIMAEPRALVRVPDAQPVDVHAVHPPPPLDGQQRTWQRVLRDLPRADPRDDRSSILIGDFNATIDHHELRRLLDGDDGYTDAADAVGKGYDTTWPAGRRFPPEITIDHVLVDREIGVERVSVHTIPHSDHRAVIATLRVPKPVGRAR